jgi:hypothetical protein
MVYVFEFGENYSSEISSTYHKRGGTAISATDRWTHRVHLYGEDTTGAGIWSYFTLLYKDHNMIVISCYCVRDRGQFKECNFCGDEHEDWRHVLTCQGIGAFIFHTGSCSQLRTKMNKWKIHTDIWR